ncbi:MAG: formate dehydrogenase accessory sulfurtransferase FdhD [Ostreibacterium sp.]
MNKRPKHQLEILTTPLSAVVPMTAVDNTGQVQSLFLVREQPLTIYLNKVEVVTVMTMGAEPAYLIVGFLLNQQLIHHSNDIISIQVDWTIGAAAVYANNTEEIKSERNKRIVTSGCGQGTMFANVMENVTQEAKRLPDVPTLTREKIYDLLALLSIENSVYKKAGGVHSCALCTDEQVIKTIEDVGRHNAVDSLTGFMALEDLAEQPMIMYTTGRLTSEMVIKTVQMRLPFIISRSGATSMGVEVAEAAGITLVSRAKGKRFLVLTGQHRISL